MKHFAIILFVLFLVTACGNRNSGNNNANNNEDNDSLSVEVFDTDVWLGNYDFQESIPPNVNMIYHFTIYKEKEEYYAKVIIDGYQTITRLLAKLKIEDRTASLIFVKYLPENLFTPYKEGDVLLTLERKDEKTLTTWGKIEPIDNNSKPNGKIYFTLSSEPVYNAGWCGLRNLSMPEINTNIIKGEYAKQCNREIREIYDWLKDDHDEFFAQYNNSGHGPEASYNWAVTGDILSIMIAYDSSGFSASIGSFKFFNLNMKTGQPISADELIQLAGITPKDIKTTIELSNNSDKIGVLQYKEEYDYRNRNMYFDEKGLTIYLVYVLNEACENDGYIPFRPKEWMHTRTTDITMDEAVDILAKKLNDPTLKFMLGEEYESETIKGEKTHYIRAYHESPDGESIATLGYFYIGCRSGKIYIMDIIIGNDIVPYDDYLKKYKS